MSRPVSPDDASVLRLPAPSPPAVTVVALIWLAFAGVMPVYQVREARRQARQDLLRVLAAGKPDAGGVIAAFDRSNQSLDAAASGPCLILAFTCIFLANQTLKLRRQYHALTHDLSTPDRRRDDVG